LGRGASGGGSAANTTASPLGTGGAGADGYINITVFGYASINLPDFSADMTTGVPGTLIHFHDESVINNGAGLAYNWSFGDGTYSSVAGDPQHVYSYTGSYDVSLTLTSSDGTSTETKYAYINIVSEPPVVSPYFPNTVRFTVMNYLGSNVVGATVNATYVQSTLPGGIDFLESAYHIDSETAAAMMSSSIVMSGQTGDDGGIVFSMHPSLQYRITANSSQGNISVLVYPKETDYNLWLPAPNGSSVYRDINVTLTFSEPNVTAISMGAMYQDFTGATSSLLFYVNKSDGTPVYSQTSVPGTTKVTFNKTIANVRGEMYYWGVRGTRTGGNVSLDQGVTAKGPNGVLVDLRLPNTMYYPWISIFLLFMITSLASKNNIRFIAIILPLMAAMFWWFGWLTGSYLGSVIPLTGIIGAIYYMKGSLRENYGVGGPGSMLINIVVFLLIFQMMIGFINGLGVFDKATFMADPATQFSNVDLTDVQTGVQNFGGINDPLQSTSAIGTVAWATVKIAMQMIGAALLISVTLTEMFPYVPAEFFVIIQALVYIIYVLFIIKLFWKAGSEVDL
jgi:PKD repeat protein